MKSIMLKLEGMLPHIKNSIWSLLEYFVYPFLMLGATPFFFERLGAYQYGQWMLVSTFAGMSNLIGAGIGLATIKEISIIHISDKKSEIVRVVSASFSLMLIISSALTGLFLILAQTYGKSFFLNIASAPVLVVIFNCAAVLVFLEQLDVVFSSALRGMERFDLSAKIESGFKIVILLVAAGVVLLQANVINLLYTLVAGAIFRFIGKWMLVSRMLGVSMIFPVWDLNRSRNILNFGKWNWIQSIGGACYSSADRAIIGSVLGAESLARYSIILQLAQQIHAIPAAAMASIYPKLSRKHQERSNPLHWLKKIINFNLLLSALLALPLIFLPGFVLSFWMGDNDVIASSLVLSVAAVAFFVLSVNISSHYILLAYGRADSVAYVNLIGGVVAVIFVSIFVESYGLYAAAMSRIIYGLFVSINFISVLNLGKIYGGK